MMVAKRYFGIGLLAALVTLPTSVGAWSYEQIDTAGNWSGVEIEVMPTGMVWVCYHDSVSGHIFLAHKNSIWHRDDLGVWNGSVGHHLVQGPGQRPAVLLRGDSVVTYALDTDTGWVTTTLPWPRHVWDAFLAFDSSGNPAVLYIYTRDSYHNVLATSHKRESGWTEDYVDESDQHWPWYLNNPTSFACGADAQFCFDYGKWHDMLTYEEDIYADTGRTGAWSPFFLGGGYHTTGSVVSSAPTLSPGITICYVCHSYDPPDTQAAFYCDGEMVDAWAGAGRIRIDSRNLRQIVYRLGVMKLAYRTSVWHIDTLPPEINAAQSFDFAVDNNDMPLIAFSTPDGIFLATGDAVGVAEKPSQAVPEPLRLPTIVRGTLEIGPQLTANGLRPGIGLFDANGRRIAKLHAGANGLSRLAPGVYFVRSAGGGQRAAEKVVIQR